MAITGAQNIKKVQRTKANPSQTIGKKLLARD
jgi:hypothetical protein